MAKSKKIAIVVAAIALIAVIGVVGSTLAFFTDRDQKTNVFTMGNVNGTLEETSDDGKVVNIPEDGIEFDKIVPGDNINKVPYMKLGANSSDAYARIKLTWQDANGQDVTGADLTKLQEIGLDIPTSWVLGNDGYYYYQTKLTKDAPQTANIFTTVTIPTTWGNEMANKTFKLKIDGELIQAENTGITEGNITSWPQADIQKYEGQ